MCLGFSWICVFLLFDMRTLFCIKVTISCEFARLKAFQIGFLDCFDPKTAASSAAAHSIL